MTQTDLPTWLVDIQAKLVAALDAVWKTIDGSDDPEVIRKASNKAKACGLVATMARKVGLLIPAAGRTPLAKHALAGLHATEAVANLSAMVSTTLGPAASPSQADLARKALAMKGGGRGRL